MNRKMLILSLSVFCSSALFAVDAVLNRPENNAQQIYWASASNWVDKESGATLTEPPTNAHDNVFLPAPDKNIYLQRLGTGINETTSNSRSFSVGSVTGDNRHKICHTFNWAEGTPTPRHSLTVFNPNQFTGLWFSGDAHAIFRFPASETFMPQISALSANARPEVEIPDAGTSAKLSSLYNGGALTKRGGGELVLGGTRGADVRLYVEEGSLTLDGRAAGDTRASLLAKAALHLDATAESSLTKLTAGEDGRVQVSQWADVRGNGVAAATPSSSSRLRIINNPFIANNVANALPIIDFGSSHADEESVAKWGPTNCLMKFAKMENVREAFYVAKYHRRLSFNGKAEFNVVLGDNVAATLQPADCLFGGSANFGARTGDIYANGVRIDGKWWPDSGYGLTNINVISVGSPSNMVFSTIASEQEYSERTGGMMIGEIILYTNELTRVERMRVHQYLCDKWLRKDCSADVDAGQVFLQGGENSPIGVSSGRTASVVDIIAGSDGKIVKTGDGTLEVDALYPANALVSVCGGSVRIARSVGASETDAPAAEPAVWLDATAADSLVYEEGEEEPRRIVSWTDRRGGVVATASDVRPSVVGAASPTGLAAVDFGSGEAKCSYVKFPWWGDLSAKFTAGFAVVRQLVSDRTYVPYFGSKNMTFMREGSLGGSHCRFISENYTHPALGAAVWTLNGVPQDPIVYNKALSDKTDFTVVAFSASEKVLVDAIAFARNSASYCGGMQVGEVLLYDRELTDSERRNTEAYLMRRWLGAEHPAAAAPNPSYEFADGVDAVLDSDIDISVASLSGGSGTLAKKGAGKVVLSEGLAAGQIKKIEVCSGKLHVPFVRTFMDEALFHFDASDAGSLVYATDDNGEAYLSEWLDVRRNGVKATTVLNDAAGHVKKKPSLVELEVRPGVKRILLKFGGVLGGDAAAMLISENFANVREGHTVHKDISKNSMFFSHSHLNPAAPTTSQYNDFYRTSDGSFFGSSAAEALKKGYIATNGAPMEAYTDIVPTETTLFSMAADADLRVNSIQYDRTVPGGAYVGEQLAFSRKLDADERDYLQKHLMWKWFGEGERPVWPGLNFDSIDVAKDASLSLPALSQIPVAALSGTGAVACGEIFGIADVSVKLNDAASGNFMTVDGNVGFAAELAVKVEGDGTLLAEGEYTILETQGITAQPETVRLDISKVSRPKLYKLAFSGNRLVLKVLPKGLRVIVR